MRASQMYVTAGCGRCTATAGRPFSSSGQLPVPEALDAQMPTLSAPSSDGVYIIAQIGGRFNIFYSFISLILYVFILNILYAFFRRRKNRRRKNRWRKNRRRWGVDPTFPRTAHLNSGSPLWYNIENRYLLRKEPEKWKISPRE